MTEHPISFRADMIEAILAGRKTQTRRVLDVERAAILLSVDEWRSEWHRSAPNAWRGWHMTVMENLAPGLLPCTNEIRCPYGHPGDQLWTKRQRFQRRADADAWLKVVAVRVERVQDITEADAMAEGVADVAAFRLLWNEINAKRGYPWDSNPWCWVISFRRID